MSTLPTISNLPEAITKALMQGDLSLLKPDEKLIYYRCVCESTGLNPLTKPFEYIKLNGKEVLYAGKNCAEQLRQIHKISIEIKAREKVDSMYIVTARAGGADGRYDESIAAVDLGNLKGDAAANAIMKAETKAKRRVTLSICGLGMLDETEVASIPMPQNGPIRAKEATVIDKTTGEVLDEELPPWLAVTPLPEKAPPAPKPAKKDEHIIRVQTDIDTADWYSLGQHILQSKCSKKGKSVHEVCKEEPAWVIEALGTYAEKFIPSDKLALEAYLGALQEMQMGPAEGVSA